MDNYPLLNLFLTMLYLFLWVAWIFLLFRIVVDVFRSRDLSGWGKAGWILLILVLPWLGVLIYLVARGGRMHERDVEQAQANQQAVDDYLSERIRATAPAAGTAGATPGSASTTAPSQVDELAKLADLHRAGTLSDDEFARMKAKILA